MTGKDYMNIIVVLAIVVGAAWFFLRRGNRQAEAGRLQPPRKPHNNIVHKTFVHGNTCLMEGKFDEARAAFEQVRALDPKHPHIAGRLAEVERQQQAASAVAAANATC
jgi:hypothetical protein